MRKLSNDELNRLTVPEFKTIEKAPVVIILDNVRSLHNVGSVFRTTDAFALEGIYLCGITGQPPHREIQRSALGATESVDWSYFESTAEAIRFYRTNHNNGKVYAIEQAENSSMLDAFEPVSGIPMALVFGNEINGVSDDVMAMIDGCIEIPQFGTKHSFNISVSAGIVIWELIRKLKAAKETIV